MDNTYGKQTRAFDKLGCALSGHITMAAVHHG